MGEVFRVPGDSAGERGVVEYAVEALHRFGDAVREFAERPFGVDGSVKPLLHILALGKPSQVWVGAALRGAQPVEAGSVPNAHNHAFATLCPVVPNFRQFGDEPVGNGMDVVLAERDRTASLPAIAHAGNVEHVGAMLVEACRQIARDAPQAGT